MAHPKRKNIVALTGAGISAPSGVDTFRDPDGIWSKFSIEEVATPEAWQNDPGKVLQFYNGRRSQLAHVEPNEAHFALARLEEKFNVTIVTQNIDDLHERAGSQNIIHLHGQLTIAQSTVDESLLYNINTNPINIGDYCERESQLRPNVVWFGEAVPEIENSIPHLQTADILIVAGTSLNVYPAAGLIDYAKRGSEKHIVDLDTSFIPLGFTPHQGSIEITLPRLVTSLLNNLR
ncbi:NAD-dependent deacylase [Puniceicoccaceae bacterium K14]|nr:NAD-dependent deacylase [Puniceicoccaceae bacterium K14]